MSIRNFVPTIWSAKLFQELDKAHVLVPLCNRDYEGEIKSYGDTVKINAVGNVTIGDYAPNVTSITPEQLTDQQMILKIDKSKYFAFYIDDVDNAQTKPKLMGEAMRKAAYGLSDAADSIIAGFYSEAGTTVTSTAVNAANCLHVLSQAALALDKNNVPGQGRWMVIPPWMHQKLILASILETDGSINADGQFGNGFLGRAFGFNLYMSNNLSTGVGAAHVDSHYGLAGTDRAMSFAEQIVKMEAYRPQSAFSDAVKGLHVYGARVVDPSALVSINIATTHST